MDATILRSFVDEPKGRPAKRYYVGDVVSMSKNDFDRIQDQSGGKYLKEGRHAFGRGICYPCQKTETTKKKTKSITVKSEDNGK